MKISEVIRKLRDIKTAYGDVEVHLEVGEYVPCIECGDPKYIMFCGMCKSIRTINVNQVGICAWLVADKE